MQVIDWSPILPHAGNRLVTMIYVGNKLVTMLLCMIGNRLIGHHIIHEGNRLVTMLYM